MNIAIITGASSGMGKEFVTQIAQKYSLDEIWVIARRKERLIALQDLVKTKITPISLDLTNLESFEVLKKELLNKNPSVQILVNAGGYGKFSEFLSLKEEDIIGMCDLNLKALMLTTKIVLPYIVEGGKIIEVASLSSFEPVPHLAVYAATKAGVLSFTRALNHELKPKKIRAVALCPYWVKTEFFDRANEKESLQKFDILYEANFVVKKALKTVEKGKKDYVVPGKYASFIRFLAKFLPHKLMMKTMDSMFKYENK